MCQLRKNCESAWDLYNFIIELEYVYEQGHITSAMSWLKLLINLEDIQFDIAKYDDGVLYCKCVWEYEKTQMKHLKVVNLELIRFHYAWSALECFISYFIPKEKIEQHGKINALCGWLLQNLNVLNIPELYDSITLQVAKELSEDEQFKKEFEESGIDDFGRSNKPYVNENGYGIYMVYKVRNLFAHGALKFPEYFNEEECISALSPETISKSTTLVLMTIVMMFYVDTKDNGSLIEHTQYLKNSEGISVGAFLKKLFVREE